MVKFNNKAKYKDRLMQNRDWELGEIFNLLVLTTCVPVLFLGKSYITRCNNLNNKYELGIKSLTSICYSNNPFWICSVELGRHSMNAITITIGVDRTLDSGLDLCGSWRWTVVRGQHFCLLVAVQTYVVTM